MSLHDTEREKSFIRKLGHGTNKDSAIERIDLLWNYLSAAKNRTDWGTIDKGIILEFVWQQINEEEDKQVKKLLSRLGFD